DRPGADARPPHRVAAPRHHRRGLARRRGRDLHHDIPDGRGPPAPRLMRLPGFLIAGPALLVVAWVGYPVAFPDTEPPRAPGPPPPGASPARLPPSRRRRRPRRARSRPGRSGSST